MISRVLLPAFVAVCIAFTGGSAFAQSAVPGCNPQVTDAMTKKNDALVGYDMSVVQQVFDKPDSVLATTCFNKAAGLDGSEAGKIFSEDFMVPLKDVVEAWLTGFYDEFADASGNDTSMTAAYAGAATTLDASGPGGTAANCGYVEDWWTEDSASGGTNLGFKNEGVELQLPYLTLDLLRGTAPPAAAAADFLLKWGQTESINTVQSQLDTAMTALPLPTMPAGGFLTQNTICAVLVQGGITCP